MLRNVLFFVAGIVVVLVLFRIWNQDDSDDIIERRSSDGRLQLNFPLDALPQGVQATDIRIEKIDSADIRAVIGMAQPHFAYRLEPGGLLFRKPVQLEIDTGDWSLQELPMLIHRSGNALQALNLNIVSTGDQIDSVTTQIQHFSEVLGFSSVMSVVITDPGNQNVDTLFDINVSAGARPTEVNKIQGDPNGIWSRQRVAHPVSYSGGLFSVTGTITPNTIIDRPDNYSTEPTAQNTEFGTFECTRVSTGNVIKYSVKIDFNLVLSSYDAPNHEPKVAIDDTLTVRTQPFNCLPPLPPPPPEDDFPAGISVIEKEERFEVSISKLPAGDIPVGQDFTLKTEVLHVYDGTGTAMINSDWLLKYGRFEYALITDNAISPRRVIDLPKSQSIATEDSWNGQARFRCISVGSALIDYRGFVFISWPGSYATGYGVLPVSARARVRCVANPNQTGSVIALNGSDVLGPVSSQVDNEYGAFQARWWRQPDMNRIPIGTQVKVHVELENLRTKSGVSSTGGQTDPWFLSGYLYTLAGTGLNPRRYDEAPRAWETVNALATWSKDYTFTCQNPDIAFLRHDFTMAGPESMNGARMKISISDPGLKCVPVEVPEEPDDEAPKPPGEEDE